MAQRWSVRKSMMVTLALAWFLSYADRVNMSVASIPMQAEFGWDETTKGLVMGSVFIGYIASQLIGGLLAARIGAKRLLGLAVTAFSILTLLTPLAAQLLQRSAGRIRSGFRPFFRTAVDRHVTDAVCGQRLV
jgi:ACS family sodium-dependent inorganic phosphate cotransporter